MLRVWRERSIVNNDVWFIQCKSANEWIGDIVNDIGDTNLRDRFELDIANKTLFIRGDECLIPGILHKTVEALSFFLHHSTLLEPSFNSMGLKGVSEAEYDEFPLFIWRTNLSSVLDFERRRREVVRCHLGAILLVRVEPPDLFVDHVTEAVNAQSVHLLFGSHLEAHVCDVVRDK
jgi:hypothetical protein